MITVRTGKAVDRAIDPQRLKQVMNWPLKHGSHAPNLQGNLCAMEAVAYIAGEPWADHPACACPAITTFMVLWNDALPTDADRDRLLKPLIPSLVGTRADPAIEKRRAFLVLDWLVRVFVPTFLELDRAHASYGQALRNLAEIVDLASAFGAEQIMIDAYEAVEAADEKVARDGFLEDATTKAALDGAGDAAVLAVLAAGWEVAKNTAWHTGGNAVEYSFAATEPPPTEAPVQAAAVETAWSPLVTAPCNATLDVALVAAKEAAAMDCARADVMLAATAAATQALAPTVEWLRASAVDLVRRMIDVRRV
jgi:hypothetical protein